MIRRWNAICLVWFCFAVAAIAFGSPANAQKTYGPGVSDAEIKIGNISPYSGALSLFGKTGQTMAAYFKMINEQGGVNGRKIVFISYDDGYSPPKTAEQARKLVDGDDVLLIFASLGTAPNAAIQKFMNDRKVPQLFVGSGASRWNDPNHFPWTMGWGPSNRGEGRIYGRYILESKPDAKIGILYQNDDYGKDFVGGLLEGLDGKIKPVAQVSYEATDPTVDSQIARLQSSGADVFFNVSTGKFAAQAIKKVAELNWHPLHILDNPAASIGAVLKPAGLENAKGAISAAYVKDPADPIWRDDAGFQRWSAFIDKYMPGEDKSNSLLVQSYSVAQTMVHVLKMAGDNLTRENVMKQAANINDLELDMLLPGVKINTSPNDFSPVSQMQLQVFNGEKWEQFGPMYSTGARK